MIRYITCKSPIGELTVAGNGHAVTGLWLAGQKYDRNTLPEDAEEGSDALLAHCLAWLERYFAGEQPPIDFPLEPDGTPFQQAVWRLLRQIPYGETVTYGALAKALNCRSAQAVGGAVGRNPISILIPCHRVVGAGGGLTGFAGGLEVKARLLQLENSLL